MSKKLLTSYTFDASAQTIVSADFTSLEKIQLITNVTDQVIIYNFADSTKGGTLSGTTLTLEYDTTSMADADKLQIFVEDAAQTVPVTQSGTWNVTNISGTVSLPTGAATSANQTTVIGHLDGVEGLLTTIDADTSNISTKIDTIAGAVSGTEFQVDVLSSALPTGAATSAKQDTIIGHVDGIETLIGTTNTTLGTIDADTGNISTKIDTIAGAISGTEMQVDLASAIPAGTNNIGDVDIFSNTVKDGSGTRYQPLVDTDGHLQIDVLSGGIAGTQYTEADTDATITGTAIMWEDTSDTLRAVSATKPLPVDLATTLDSTNDSITAVLSATDNAVLDTIDAVLDTINAKLVTGTVIGDVNLGATDNAVLDSIDADLTTIIGHVDGIETLIGTTNTTLGTIDADTGNIVTSIQLIDDAVATIASATPTKGIVAIGHDGTNARALKTDTSGELQIDVLSMPTTTVQATNLDIRDLTNTDVVTAELSAVDNAVLDAIAASLNTLDNVVSGSEAQVDVVGALPAGTNNIGDVDIASIAAGDNNIGNVDIASIAAGDNNIGNVDIASALPAGTNAIGKLAANSGVDIGDVDVTSLPALAAGTNAIGKLLPPDVDVTAHTNYAKKYYTSAGAATDGIIWSPAAGKRWHVTNLVINVSAAATVTLEDDKSGGDEAVMKFELAANSGVVIPFNEKYPFASGEDAADLTITTTAGNVYVTCVGYEV